MDSIEISAALETEEGVEHFCHGDNYTRELTLPMKTGFGDVENAYRESLFQ